MFMMKKKSTSLNHLRTLCSDIRKKHFRPSAEVEVWITKYSAYDFHVNCRMTQDTFYTLLRFLNQVSPDISYENYTGGNVPICFKKNIFICLWYFGKEGLNHQFIIS